MDDGSAPTYDDFTVEYVHFEGAGGVGGFGERVYLSPRASTDPGACYSDSTTLSSQDLGCDEFFAGSTTADNATHSSTDRHHSEHVYSTTSSC